MKEKAFVLAAAILASGMVLSVVLYEHAEDARITRREHQAECQKNRQAFDGCLSARHGTADFAELDLTITKQCNEFW